MRQGKRDKGKGEAPRAGNKSRQPSEKSKLRAVLGMLLLLTLCLLAGSAIAAQPPATPDGFVPASSLPNQEQLPAAPLVIGAYSIVWLLVFFYLWSIWNRIGRVEQDLADVSRRIAASQRQ
jgi:CcmD family protein